MWHCFEKIKTKACQADIDPEKTKTKVHHWDIVSEKEQNLKIIKLMSFSKRSKTKDRYVKLVSKFTKIKAVQLDDVFKKN